MARFGWDSRVPPGERQNQERRHEPNVRAHHRFLIAKQEPSLIDRKSIHCQGFAGQSRLTPPELENLDSYTALSFKKLPKPGTSSIVLWNRRALTCLSWSRSKSMRNICAS